MSKITIFALTLNVGGIEKYISTFCEMFHDNYEIDLIVTYKPDKVAFKFPENIKIAYLVNNNINQISLKTLLKKRKLLNFIREIIKRIKKQKLANKKNIEIIKNLKTDYILTTIIYHHKLVNKYYNGNAIKIATEHNHPNNNQKYIKSLIHSTTNYNYVIHCTKELYDFYQDKITKPQNILINHSIKITNLKSKLNNKNILFVGRLTEEKGPIDIINIMKEVNLLDKDVKLTVCGDGFLKEKMMHLTKEYNLSNNIYFKGNISSDELSKVYLNSSLLVLTSYTETFGLVLLEAMNYGLCCLAFDSASGARNILINGSGILIQNRDIKMMAENIVSILNNKSELLEYQERSLKEVKKYDIKEIKKEWEEKIFSK